MKRAPATVIPIPLEGRRKSRIPRAGGGACRSGREHPIRALVVDPAAEARQLVCSAGRRAAGGRSQWIEAAGGDAALQMLAGSEIDIVVADSRSIEGVLQGMACAFAAVCANSPLVVVLSEDDEPGRIQEILDAGIECCLPKSLPQHMLESEIRRLVMKLESRRPVAVSVSGLPLLKR